MRRALLPVFTGVLTVVLTATSLVLTAPAVAEPDPVVAAADTWLRAQIETDGGFELADFAGFETPDAILAVATAAQTGATWNRNAARAAVSALQRDGRSGLGWADDWVDGAFGGFGAGQAAKLIALVAAPLGIDPRDFDPDDDSASAVDLVATMDEGRKPDGSFSTCNATLFSLIADNALRRTPNAATVAYVRAAQKPNGTWDFACDSTGSGVDVDTTAYAVLGLIAAGEAPASPAVTAAVTSFASAMLADGGWGDDYGSGLQVNPNSTALAAVALTAAGRDVRTRGWRDAAAPARAGEPYTDPVTTITALQQPDGRIAGPFDSFFPEPTTFATSQSIQGLVAGRAASWWAQGPNRPIGVSGRWSNATLDGATGAEGSSAPATPDGRGGNTTSLLYAGAPHVFYYDSVNGDLRHAWWTGAAWAFETLDGDRATDGRVAGDVGIGASSLLWGGTPHVFHTDRSSGDLRHAWWDGTRWNNETLDGDSTDDGRVDTTIDDATSVVEYAGFPHVWYHDAANGDLRHAWWDGTRWYRETLDGDSTDDGRTDASVGSASSVVVWDGGPHVFYDDDTNGDLRHAWWDGTRWNHETLDGDSDTEGRVTSDTGTSTSATVFGGTPHVFYGDGTDGDLRHAWWTGTRWFYERLDGAGGAGGRLVGDMASPSTVVLYGGRPHVLYRERSGGDLRHAWWTGVTWLFETLDGVGDELLAQRGRLDGDVGRSPTALQYGDQLQVWHLGSGSTGDTEWLLRQAWWSPGTPDF